MKKIFKSLALSLLIVPCAFMLFGCTTKVKEEMPSATNQETVLTEIKQISKEQAWNVMQEAKYKFNTSYNNCLNNLSVNRIYSYQSGSKSNISNFDYVQTNLDTSSGLYTIRYTLNLSNGSKYDDIYYEYTKHYNVINGTTETVENYNNFRPHNQFSCLTNLDLSNENLLYGQLLDDNTCILKFIKTVEGIDSNSYIAYYEVEISNEGMFVGFKSYKQTHTSSGYESIIETYSYGTVNSEDILNLLPSEN